MTARTLLEAQKRYLAFLIGTALMLGIFIGRISTNNYQRDGTHIESPTTSKSLQAQSLDMDSVDRAVTIAVNKAMTAKVNAAQRQSSADAMQLGVGRETCWPLRDQVRFVKDIPKVTGIIRPISAFVANVIAVAQIREGLRGSVGEIGAFQGKFTLCLLLSARKEEVRNGWFIADAFERLHEFGGNPNGGVGCQSCFEKQVDQWAEGALEFVKYYIGDNKKIRGSDIPKKMQPFRMFSIDGDHSFEGTMIDLCVVARRIVPGGVVVIDDIHNIDWPDVLRAWKVYVKDPTACDSYGEAGASQLLEPFAAIGNKLYVTTLGQAPLRPNHWASIWAEAIIDADEAITERYKLRMRSGVLKLGNRATDGPVELMFVPRPGGSNTKLLSDHLALKGEGKVNSADNGEPLPGHPNVHDQYLTDMHRAWLERADHACPQ